MTACHRSQITYGKYASDLTFTSAADLSGPVPGLTGSSLWLHSHEPLRWHNRKICQQASFHLGHLQWAEITPAVSAERLGLVSEALGFCQQQLVKYGSVQYYTIEI